MKSSVHILLLICLICLIYLCSSTYLFAGTAGTQEENAAREAQMPIGQVEEPMIPGEEGITADVFGKKGGYLHPFLMLEEMYTDNLYNTDTGEEEDFITTISPGLWLALPSNREKLLEIGTTTTSPGGLNMSRIKPEATRRYQTYLLYSPEFVFYKNNSQHDTVNHQAEGLFQYNFNMGLSLDVIDQYNITHEANNNGISEELDKYKDNLFNILAIYQPSEKFKFRVDYSNFDLDYDEDENNYMDRNDDSFACYIFYKIKPKTSIFAEYEFSDIEFDTFTASDSVEHRYYAGVQWDVTAKTRGRFKIGYIDKDFDNSGVEDQDDYSVEIQAQHNFTAKRAIELMGFRRFNESNFIDSSSFLTTGASAAWLQRFNDKWSGTLEVSYTYDEYYELFVDNQNPKERTDKIFSFSPAIRYEMKDWLTFDLGYTYINRDSDIDRFDFINNAIVFRGNISL